MCLLKCTDVTKIIGKRTILNKISFEVKPGEVLGFCGMNGSGKTVLFKSCCGMTTINGGKILFKDRDIFSYDFSSEIGIYFSQFGFLDYLSGWENLRFIAGLYHNISQERINSVLAQVGLSDVKHNKVRTYSLGMRARLGIAGCIIHDPKLMFWDEPTNALDKLAITVLKDVIDQARQFGKSILINSHHEDFLKEVCDRIYQIEEGECRLKVGDRL